MKQDSCDNLELATDSTGNGQMSTLVGGKVKFRSLGDDYMQQEMCLT